MASACGAAAVSSWTVPGGTSKCEPFKGATDRLFSITDAIADVSEKARQRDTTAAAEWTETAGWRLDDHHFEDLLAERRGLTDNDRAELRRFRLDLRLTRRAA